MTDKTTNGSDDKTVVEGKDIGKAANPISKATLIMIIGTIIFVIVAAVIITGIFRAPTGTTGTGATNSASRTGQ